MLRRIDWQLPTFRRSLLHLQVTIVQGTGDGGGNHLAVDMSKSYTGCFVFRVSLILCCGRYLYFGVISLCDVHSGVSWRHVFLALQPIMVVFSQPGSGL
jgi:hypothetical protein